MTALRIQTADEVFATASVGWAAAQLLTRAEAMGFLDDAEVISRLDTALLTQVLQRLGAAGLVQSSAVRGRIPADEPGLTAILQQANAALEHSPVPEQEWPTLRAILGDDLLVRLSDISLASLRRYVSGQRPTPDPVARRLHVLALIVADLRGAYNDYGIRRWFDRPRAQLNGRAPASILPQDWTPETPEALELRALAAALLGSPAT